MLRINSNHPINQPRKAPHALYIQCPYRRVHHFRFYLIDWIAFFKLFDPFACLHSVRCIFAALHVHVSCFLVGSGPLILCCFDLFLLALVVWWVQMLPRLVGSTLRCLVHMVTFLFKLDCFCLLALLCSACVCYWASSLPTLLSFVVARACSCVRYIVVCFVLLCFVIFVSCRATVLALWCFAMCVFASCFSSVCCAMLLRYVFPSQHSRRAF